jgi:RecB family exonuclease
VQEGSWPDVRRRGSLLQADRLGPDGLVDAPGVSALLAEERRLFYVAATRARERLVVTAVAAPEQDGDQPSRLLDVLGARATSVVGRPDRPLSLPGLVAALRRVAADPEQSDGVRLAAAARLARLADERSGSDRRAGGRPVVPAADPQSWWGLRDRTDAAVPVRPADEPLALSGSALGGLLECPLRWFLAREAAGESARSSAMGFGNVLHVLADHLATADAVTEQSLLELLDTVWESLHFGSPWIARREHAEARAAVQRLLAWHRGRPGREVVASEADFDVTVPLEGAESVRLRGRVDRLEQDADGTLHIVDFKTSKNPPSGASLPDNPQLGLYQLAADRSAFAAQAGPQARSGGAELVQLRVGSGAGDNAGLPKVQEQAPQQADEAGRTPVEVQLISAAATVREERFDAMMGSHCTFCDFTSMCPAQVRSGSVLS